MGDTPFPPLRRRLHPEARGIYIGQGTICWEDSCQSGAVLDTAVFGGGLVVVLVVFAGLEGDGAETDCDDTSIADEDQNNLKPLYPHMVTGHLIRL